MLFISLLLVFIGCLQIVVFPAISVSCGNATTQIGTVASYCNNTRLDDLLVTGTFEIFSDCGGDCPACLLVTTLTPYNQSTNISLSQRPVCYPPPSSQVIWHLFLVLQPLSPLCC